MIKLRKKLHQRRKLRATNSDKAKISFNLDNEKLPQLIEFSCGFLDNTKA